MTRVQVITLNIECRLILKSCSPDSWQGHPFLHLSGPPSSNLVHLCNVPSSWHDMGTVVKAHVPTERLPSCDLEITLCCHRLRVECVIAPRTMAPLALGRERGGVNGGLASTATGLILLCHVCLLLSFWARPGLRSHCRLSGNVKEILNGLSLYVEIVGLLPGKCAPPNPFTRSVFYLECFTLAIIDFQVNATHGAQKFHFLLFDSVRDGDHSPDECKDCLTLWPCSFCMLWKA